MGYNRGKKIMRKTVFLNTNKVVISGNICGEVTTHQGQKGEAKRFNIAHNSSKDDAMFLTVVVLGNATATTESKISADLSKGKSVTVEGRLRITKNEKDGKTFWNHEVLADKVYPTETKVIEISDDGSDVKFVDPVDDLPY